MANEVLEEKAPALDTEKVLADPSSHGLNELETALGQRGAKNDDEPAAPQAQAFDPAKEIAALKDELKRQQQAFSKELGQYRKLQGEYAKLPQTLESLLDKKLKAPSDPANLTPEQQLALIQAKVSEQEQHKALQALIEQKAQEKVQEALAAREAPQQYVQVLQSMAGDQMETLAPYLAHMVSSLTAAMQSEDEATAANAARIYDALSQNPGAALWEASRLAQQAAANGGGQEPKPQAQPQQQRTAPIAPRIADARNGGNRGGADKPKDFSTLSMAEIAKLRGIQLD